MVLKKENIRVAPKTRFLVHEDTFQLLTSLQIYFATCLPKHVPLNRSKDMFLERHRFEINSVVVTEVITLNKMFLERH